MNSCVKLVISSPYSPHFSVMRSFMSNHMKSLISNRSLSSCSEKHFGQFNVLQFIKIFMYSTITKFQTDLSEPAVVIISPLVLIQFWKNPNTNFACFTVHFCQILALQLEFQTERLHMLNGYVGVQFEIAEL